MMGYNTTRVDNEHEVSGEGHVGDDETIAEKTMGFNLSTTKLCTVKEVEC